MRVVFDRQEPLTPDISTFWFKPQAKVDYIAGQYTELRLPHPSIDDRGDKRWFTLSSSPSDPMLSITTKFDSMRASSFKTQLKQLKTGTELNLAEPMGDFVLPKDTSIPLLFIAGGMGITPIHSMIKWLKDTGEQRSIRLAYAVTKREDLVWHDLFASYDLDFIPIIKVPPADWQGETGSLDAKRILDLVNPLGQPLIYISGPEVMVEVFVKDLSAHGVESSRLVTDYFPGYPKL